MDVSRESAEDARRAFRRLMKSAKRCLEDLSAEDRETIEAFLQQAQKELPTRAAIAREQKRHELYAKFSRRAVRRVNLD